MKFVVDNVTYTAPDGALPKITDSTVSWERMCGADVPPGRDFEMGNSRYCRLAHGEIGELSSDQVPVFSYDTGHVTSVHRHNSATVFRKRLGEEKE